MPSTARSEQKQSPRSVRPFLKWAGGKRQLLPQLRRFIPPQFGHYYEPFVGSGALFFDLAASSLLGGRRVRLIDTNADLIGCYRALAWDVEAVIHQLRRLEHGHRALPREHYYRVRDGLFNPAHRVRSHSEHYAPELAAMFIYLNRTGFNGLYRLNASGDFNVPLGRYVNPMICNADNLRAVSAVLRSPNVQLTHAGFDAVRDHGRSGDLIYFDPPYAPLSSSASFTSYTASGFTEADQRRLQELVIELAARGCHIIVSNSTAPLVTQLFARNVAAKRAGLRAHQVRARRAINSDAAKRGNVMEYIISNVEPSH